MLPDNNLKLSGLDADNNRDLQLKAVVVEWACVVDRINCVFQL
jgi:hypothetical protein